MSDEKKPAFISSIIDEFVNTGKIKADRKFTKTLILSILAGAFIAFGAYSSLLVRLGLPAGLGRFIAGIVFSSGLIMITMTGAELFTGNILMTFSLFEKKIKIFQMLKNWLFVWFGNFAGALLAVFLIIYSTKQPADYLNLTYTTALNKVSLSPLNCFISGILCNWLVCMAVYMAQYAKDAASKILGIVFPITVFIIAGYEHSVANMFFIPSGMAAQFLLENTPETFITAGAFLHNIIPVTLGNIAGAILFVSAPLFLAHKK